MPRTKVAVGEAAKADAMKALVMLQKKRVANRKYQKKRRLEEKRLKGQVAKPPKRYADTTEAERGGDIVTSTVSVSEMWDKVREARESVVRDYDKTLNSLSFSMVQQLAEVAHGTACVHNAMAVMLRELGKP